MNNFEKIIEISCEDLEKISGGGGDDLIDGVCSCVGLAVQKINDFYTDAKAGKNDFVNAFLVDYGVEYSGEEENKGWKFEKKKALNFSGVFVDEISNFGRAGSIAGLSAFVVAGSYALKKIKGFFNTIC